MALHSLSEPAGPSPRLRGCSLLFNNPGQSLLSSGDLLYYRSETETDSTPPLYQILHETVAPREIGNTINLYLRPAKPASCYHVTVWGGINDTMIANVEEPLRTTLRDWLDRLPDSVCECNLLTKTILPSPLIQRANWNMRFRFDKIVNWHDACLAAVLLPFDAHAEQVLQEIIRERAVLSEEFERIFGIKTPAVFVPHITLRRFVDRDSAQRCMPYIDALSEEVQSRAGSMPLTFDSISLYGFTDVTRIFKRNVYEPDGDILYLR